VCVRRDDPLRNTGIKDGTKSERGRPKKSRNSAKRRGKRSFIKVNEEEEVKARTSHYLKIKARARVIGVEGTEDERRGKRIIKSGSLHRTRKRSRSSGGKKIKQKKKKKRP